MNKRTFYPNSSIIVLMFCVDTALFMIFAVMFASKIYLLIACLPLLLAPLAVTFLFRVTIDVDRRVVRGLSTALPLKYEKLMVTNIDRGAGSQFGIEILLDHVELIDNDNGLLIKGRNSDKQILLPRHFYKVATMEEIKNIIKQKVISYGTV